MNAQERTMRGLAKSLREWAASLSHSIPSTNSYKAWLIIGRLEGMAQGLDAIADLASTDDTLPAPPGGGDE